MRPMPMPTYLLATDTVFLDGGKTRTTEYVVEYSAEEMAEVFTPAQRDELARNGKFTTANRGGAVIYRDMIRAARAL